MDSRRLTLLRHGQAQGIDTCAEDFERALTRHGIAEAKEMADRIVHRDLVPDLILVSPAERAWTTAHVVGEACDLDETQIIAARELYLASPETLWRLLQRRDAALRHVLICGHNPGLSQIASRLGPHPTARDLPTAGLATAVWHHGTWDILEPELADRCDLDDPESLADPWI